jgi:hypothetical protein
METVEMMKIDEQELRNLYQQRTARLGAGREGCPSSEELHSLMHPLRLESDTRRRLADHLSTCSDCSVELRMVRSLEPWSEEMANRLRDRSGSIAPALRETRWMSRLWLAAGVAAAATLLALGLPSLWRGDEPPPSVYREGDVAGVSSLVSEEEPLPRDSFRLRWSPGPAGASYELWVGNEDLEVIFRAAELSAAEHEVPESALRDIPSGARLLWRVETLLPDGSRSVSPTFFARLE